MKLIHGDGRDWTDDEVQHALKAHYVAPPDESYWESLERRIVSRLKQDVDQVWWAWFPGWVRFGIAAAAAAAFMAAAVSWQTRAAQERIALTELLGDPSGIPLLTESLEQRPKSEREKTLRYLLSH
jgi:hypothetical protein